MNANLIIYGVSFSVALLLAVALYLLYTAYLHNDNAESHEEQLREIMGGDEEEEAPVVTTSSRLNIKERWNSYWHATFQELGWADYSSSRSAIGGKVLKWSLLAVVVLSILTRNPLAGVVITGAALYGASAFLRGQANRKAEKINSQLPGFLFALKANVQANTTPENALLNIIDEVQSPLYDDLVIVKQRIMANSSFTEAIQELGEHTNSRDLKFLCACMLQAVASGTNLEKQLTVIQAQLTHRRRINAELNKAVKSATPALWVATFTLPGFFIFTLLFSPSAKEFWFKDPLSYAVFAIVVALYLASVFFSKRLVDKIKNT